MKELKDILTEQEKQEVRKEVLKYQLQNKKKYQLQKEKFEKDPEAKKRHYEMNHRRLVERYNNDEVFREHIKAKQKEYYQKRKQIRERAKFLVDSGIVDL